jgi:hypothetical protein
MFQGLRQLSAEQRSALIAELWQAQNGRCYISEKPIDLALHHADLDIDHVIPTRDGGPDNRTNWALTFAHYNRSKQAADLRVARVLARFESIKSGVDDIRGVNLGHVLGDADGSCHSLAVDLETQPNTLRFSLAAIGQDEVIALPVWKDQLSGLHYVFANLPIEYLFHDDRLNPRGIGSNIRALVIEFFSRLPQLHVPLAWIDSGETGGVKVRIFDGQHKAAAQVLLGVRCLPVRIFIDPDPDVLLTANTHAGTTLRQVAFDKATQRHLGASILLERVERFRADRGHPDDYGSWSEQALVDHFKGEQSQMRRYVLDAQRNDITYHSSNRLRDFIEMGGKGTERPLSYSAIEKAIYSQAIHSKMLETPDDYKFDQGENPRDLERDQIVKYLNLLADRIFIGQWNPDIGSGKLESKVQNNQDVPENHLRAHRMGREEILQAWTGLCLSVYQTVVVSSGSLWDSERPFQRRLPDAVWSALDNFICNFADLSLWKNRSLSATVFGGKQTTQFWKDAFSTGIANQIVILPGGGINLIELMNPRR